MLLLFLLKFTRVGHAIQASFQEVKEYITLGFSDVIRKFSKNGGPPIDDCAKDGSKDFFTYYIAFFNRIPIQSLKIRNSNVVHLGKKFLAAIFSVISFSIGCVEELTASLYMPRKLLPYHMFNIAKISFSLNLKR